MHMLGIEPIFYNKGDMRIRDSELFQSIPFSAWGKTPSGYDWEATDAEGLFDFCHPPASFYFKMEDSSPMDVTHRLSSLFIPIPVRSLEEEGGFSQ